MSIEREQLVVGGKYLDKYGDLATVSFVGTEYCTYESEGSEYDELISCVLDSWEPKSKKKVKYYQGWYKLEDEYVVHVPSVWFKDINDFKTWLDADIKYVDSYALTDVFIEVDDE